MLTFNYKFNFSFLSEHPLCEPELNHLAESSGFFTPIYIAP
jgi:hypothetical protein